MAVNSISAASASQPAQSSNIAIQDFLKILTAQLNSQDPLKPVDNQEFVGQIAQFTSLEQSRQLNAKIDELLSVQSSLQSVGLLGKTVDISQNGGVVTGKVTALDFATGQPLLTLQTSSGAFQDKITLSQLSNVR